MKPSKVKIATFSTGLGNSQLTSRKFSIISTNLAKIRKKSSTKFINENEIMFLAPPPVAESMLKHAIAIPSENTENILDDEQIVRQVTQHLKEISSSLEETYGFDIEGERLAERVPKPEGEENTPTEAEHMNSFLLSCTSLAKQLEEAVKEEQQILDSLFKWFQKEVYHVEELVKEQNVSDWELPLPDKAVSSSIAQVIDRLQKLEHLRSRLGTVPKVTRIAVAAKHKPDDQPETTQIYEAVKKMIEDFGAHFQNDEFIENIMDIADNVFLPKSTESKDLQFQEMFKIFEKQAIKLQRIMNELDNLEFKYKMIQNDLDIVTEERMILENELKKIKGPEKTEQFLQREKTLLELQRKKSEKKVSRDSSKLGDVDRFSMDFGVRTTSSFSLPWEGQNVSASSDVPPRSSKEQIQKGRKSEVYGQRLQIPKQEEEAEDFSPFHLYPSSLLSPPSEWTLPPEKKAQGFSESQESITSLYRDHVKSEEYSGELAPNNRREAQASEDDQIEIISLPEEDDVEKKITLPDLSPSQADPIIQENGKVKDRSSLPGDLQTNSKDLHKDQTNEEIDGEAEDQSPELERQDIQLDTITDKEEPSRLSDVIISFTSLIQQLDLDKVIEISIDDFLKDTKEVRSTPAWKDVSPKTRPSPEPLQQKKISDMLEDGREGQGKHTSGPHAYPAKRISSFHQEVIEQVFPMEKKQASSLKGFGVKMQMKMAPPDRKSCLRTRHFAPLSKFFAEKESELSYKLQSQQERSTPGTSPFNRKKETYPGFMRVVNAWTISPQIEDHNLPPGNMFMPQKSRRTTFKKTFK
ncbi:coiled-coil domain-containing protein 7 [Petaurus breviceps papuanus]|uniref:coiled-coil domain-containing protein 7 n=1 Tax=Petaurus breviceps papuanus TaxID=3040969 RepID=UPI0036D9797B